MVAAIPCDMILHSASDVGRNCAAGGVLQQSGTNLSQTATIRPSRFRIRHRGAEQDPFDSVEASVVGPNKTLRLK